MDVANMWKLPCLSHLCAFQDLLLSFLSDVFSPLISLGLVFCIFCLVVLHSECPNHLIGGGDTGTYVFLSCCCFWLLMHPRKKQRTPLVYLIYKCHYYLLWLLVYHCKLLLGVCCCDTFRKKKCKKVEC